MKKFILFLGVLLVASTVSAQKEPSIRVLNDDYSSLRIEITTGTLHTGETTLNGIPFSTLNLEGCMPSSLIAEPTLPVFSRMIEVPLCDGFAVEVTDAIYDTIDPQLRYQVVPAQAPISKSDTLFHPIRMIESIYNADKFYGQREAMVETVGIARDRRLARLQFSPVRYNPVSGQVIVCRQVTVTVRYQGADREGTEEMFNRYYSPAFNSGAKPLNNLYPKAVRTTAPVRYLIVANSMFRNHLDDFVQWKRRKGFLVDVAYTNDPGVGTDTTSIQNYIKSQYTNATTANPAPTFVLLVGDVAQLPPFDAHNSSPSDDHVTDLYYMTWTTGDHIPDCHYGRFSAQTVAQLQPQIEKTLMYEKYTFPDPTFLDRAVMVAGVDAGNPGDNAYTYGDPAMDYAITNYVNGTHGWSQVMYFKNDISIIPACTTNVTIGSSASGNAATVRSYYNQGAGFINYSAHGGSTGWGTPNFGNTHVNQMTNNQKFGLMIGNCCLTNKFEESTCFGEALLRKGDYAGAVGYIGGSNSTYWGQDFYWAVGVRSSVGPTMSMAYNASNLGVYDRTFHTHNEAYSQWCTTQGSMVMQGNMAVEASTSGSGMKWYYWEIYHLMGDPSVMPYMTQADTMNVAVSSVVNYGATSLSVSAAPNAYVALVDTVTETLLAAAYANASGTAQLTLPATLAVGNYRLAASAQQYRTAFRTIRVIQPDGAFPLVTEITSAPLVAGDTVALTLHVENPGNAMAHNITIQLASSSSLLTLSTATITLDSLAAGASVDVTDAVSAYVSATAPDNTFVDISTAVNWTGSTMSSTSTLRRWIYAPVLNLTFSNENPCLLPGTTLTFQATLHNSGHAATRVNQLTFASPTTLLSASIPAGGLFSLDSDSDTTVTLTLTANAQLPQDITIPVTYNFGSFNGTLPVFVGNVYVETFEDNTTHLAGWSFPAAYPWAVSTEQPYEGSYCLRSVQYTSHNTNSDMNLSVTLAVADTVSFYYRVSSENNYDKFHFLVDDESLMNASGEVEWTRAAFLLSAGTHTLTFRYAKDYSVSNGSDCAWIDNVVLPHTSHNISFANTDVCQGSPLTIGNSSINTEQPGTGYHVSIASNGTVTLTDYTVYPSYESHDTIDACDRFTWYDTEYTASGVYGATTTTIHNCDSSVALKLTIHPSYHQNDTVEACDSYTWYDNEITASGFYADSLTTLNGCDSILTLMLDIYPSYHLSDTVEACGSYIWRGNEFTTSGYYVDNTTTLNGCEGSLSIMLTIHPVYLTTDSVEDCDMYLWHGNEYFSSGTYVDSLRTIHNCDSNVTLALTIHSSYHQNDTAEACDFYTWHGNEFTVSGFYADSLTALNGCDSIDNLYLTVNHSTIGDTVHVTTMATNYEWYGIVYDSTGIYQHHFTNSHGCDSIVTLVLTIGENEGIDDILSREGLSIYPNPTTASIHFSQRLPEVIVYDAVGRKCMQQRDVDHLDLSFLSPGIYTLRVGARAYRIVKQ